MLLGFHLILSAYGFWLPNDPRGSWSDFVGAWELFKHGKATRVYTRESVAHAAHDRNARVAAKRALKYPPVRWDVEQVNCIGEGFAQSAEEGAYDVHACAVLPEHVHMVIGRHHRPINQIASHLKSSATRVLRARQLHPFDGVAGLEGAVPSMWPEGCWKVFIDNPEHMLSAIRYVQENPRKEGRPEQRWSFVTAWR